MATVHKKREIKSEKEQPVETKTEEKKTEPVVVSDVITEKIEVIEKVAPQVTQPGAEPLPQDDPMSDFKSKMAEEEMFLSGEPQKKNYMWPILLIFIIAIVLLFGVFAYKQGMFKGTTVSKIITTPTPTVTATPTPAPTVDLTKYEIEILNGSGVSGEASSQKANLESAGFTVSSVGNADNSDYTNTIIEAKTEVDSGFIAKLKSTLSDTFTVGDTQSLSENSSVPVVVILGTKK